MMCLNFLFDVPITYVLKKYELNLSPFIIIFNHMRCSKDATAGTHVFHSIYF